MYMSAISIPLIILLAIVLLAIVAVCLGGRALARKIFAAISRDLLRRIMVDPYDENLWELVSATTRYTPQLIVETNLRTEEGKVILRPLGSPKKFPGFDQIMFNIGQLQIMPTAVEQHVDTQVTIGKACQKPLIVDLPILISGMTYGAALSEKAKIALAKGASMAGTSTNTGEGPFLRTEREAAAKLILQYNRGSWSKTEAVIKQADAIEIQFGQGASAGIGVRHKSSTLDEALRAAYGVEPGQDVISHSRQPEIGHPSQLAGLVQKLKGIAGDIPVGVKFGAGKYLEKDLEWAVAGGVDFIALDGAEAASHGSAPILQDDFGVPTLFAVARAGEYLRKNNLQAQVSLIVAGKIGTPGEMLKALALGADAVYIGAIALFALSHTQVLKALPFEPPIQLLWYKGHAAAKFDVDTGAQNLAKFLKSCNEEMIEGIKALGKTSLAQVNKEDLLALDEFMAKALGIPAAYEAYNPV